MEEEKAKKAAEALDEEMEEEAAATALDEGNEEGEEEEASKLQKRCREQEFEDELAKKQKEAEKAWEQQVEAAAKAKAKAKGRPRKTDDVPETRPNKKKKTDAEKAGGDKETAKVGGTKSEKASKNGQGCSFFLRGSCDGGRVLQPSDEVRAGWQRYLRQISSQAACEKGKRILGGRRAWDGDLLESPRSWSQGRASNLDAWIIVFFWTP